MYTSNVLVFKKTSQDSNLGYLAIKSAWNEGDKPIRHTLYWAVSELVTETRAIEFYPEVANGREQPLYRNDTALYSFRRDSGEWVNVRIIGGGQAKAFLVETTDVPMPKVRKGIETRFNSGCWQKYLKADGWVTA
jgi:hypothetical protein